MARLGKREGVAKRERGERREGERWKERCRGTVRNKEVTKDDRDDDRRAKEKEGYRSWVESDGRRERGGERGEGRGGVGRG